MNYILVYGLFNTVTAATVVAYFLFFMVGNSKGVSAVRRVFRLTLSTLKYALWHLHLVICRRVEIRNKQN